MDQGEPSDGSERPANEKKGTTMEERDGSLAPLARTEQAALDVPGLPTFDAWWALYPKKVGKGAAVKAWEKAAASVGPERLMAALEVQAPLLRQHDRRYQPHPSTWLNQGRWDDDPASLVRERERARNGSVTGMYGLDALLGLEAEEGRSVPGTNPPAIGAPDA